MLVNITVQGPLLHALFDSVKSCKGKTVLGFNEHEMTFIGAEYCGEETEDNQTLGMSFMLTRHSCKDYHVSLPIKRQIQLQDVIKITTARIFRNKTSSLSAQMTLMIEEENSSTIIFQIKDDHTTITQSVACTETSLMPFQYDDIFDCNSSRIMDTCALNNALTTLANAKHQYCTISMSAGVVSFIGHGDGKQYEQTNKCVIDMKVVDHDLDYQASGTYKVYDLQRFVKVPLKRAYIYLETNKPLLVEYMLDTTPVSDVPESELCEACLHHDLSNARESGKSVIRYILAEIDEDGGGDT